MCTIENIKKIANFLNVSPGELSYNNEQVVTRKLKNSQVSGFATIINTLIKDADTDIVKNSYKTSEKQAIVEQWINYAVLHVAHGSKDKHVAHLLLRELNKYLLSRSYFVDNSLTLADLVMFYIIHDLMKTLSPADKERYLNLSRWYDHLQQNKEIRQNNELVNLNVIYLHSWATGTHI